MAPLDLVIIGVFGRFIAIYLAVLLAIGVLIGGCFVLDEGGTLIVRFFGQNFADGLFVVTVVLGFIALFFLWVDSYHDFKLTSAAFRKLKAAWSRR